MSNTVLFAIATLLLLSGSGSGLAFASESSSAVDGSSDTSGDFTTGNSSPDLIQSIPSNTDTMELTFGYNIERLAEAIATAEGYGFNVKNFPTRNNNPGDVSDDFFGRALRMEAGKAVFASPADGWDNLKEKLNRIAAGRSRVYPLSMTFYQMAVTWTGGDNPAGWANTVTNFVGVTPDTTLGAYFA